MAQKFFDFLIRLFCVTYFNALRAAQHLLAGAKSSNLRSEIAFSHFNLAVSREFNNPLLVKCIHVYFFLIIICSFSFFLFHYDLISFLLRQNWKQQMEATIEIRSLEKKKEKEK